jgi:hypothetical protein
MVRNRSRWTDGPLIIIAVLVKAAAGRNSIASKVGPPTWSTRNTTTVLTRQPFDSAVGGLSLSTKRQRAQTSAARMGWHDAETRE